MLRWTFSVLFLCHSFAILHSVEDQNSSNDLKLPTEQKETGDLIGEFSKVERGKTEADRNLTRTISRTLMNDELIKASSQNIRIITENGVVTLRGLVNNNAEKAAIEAKIKEIDGVQKVDNQLDVKDIEIGS